MGQVLGADRFGLLQKNSNTQVQLNLSSLSDIRVTVGGQQYQVTSVLLLNTGTSGAGGIDTGGIAAITTYYVYGVITGTSTLALVASTNSTAPSGFTASKLIAYFNTDSSSFVNSVFTVGQATPIKKRTVLTSGTTFYSSLLVRKITVEMVGGGGGGGGGSTASNGSPGNPGTASTFDTLSAGGGFGGAAGNTAGGNPAGGVGGSPTIGSGWTGAGVQGNGGFSGTNLPTAGFYAWSGEGAPSFFGGKGAGGFTTGVAASTNSGAGGTGGGNISGGTSQSGGGGGAGAWLKASYNNTTIPASFTYSVGALGTGGTAAGSGSINGGSGANGLIIVEEEF